MNPLQSIQAIQKRLDDAGIASIVIGGIAVAVWGEPRLTRDVDLKVLLDRDGAGRLLGLLTPEYTSLLPDPLVALQKQAMLFVLDSLGTRFDLLLADTPYDVLAIQRGRLFEIEPGLAIRLCSPEDLIIYKLISTRTRDHEDVRGIIRRQAAVLDDGYILEWLSQFEKALDDSTLLAEYRALRKSFKDKI
jgi:hypothetical protein